jgi:putative sugar O-methyltransferase
MMPARTDGPGFHLNDDAMDALAGEFAGHDDHASAHWREMQRGFALRDGQLEGALGFGDPEAAPSAGRRILHRILQARFKKMGKRFARFADIDALAGRIAKMQSRAYTLDILRQALTLAWMFEQTPSDLRDARTILVIGDGFGTLTSLLHLCLPQAKIVLINLVKTLYADLLYIRRALPGVAYGLTNDEQRIADLLARPDVPIVALRADDAPLLSSIDIDVAFNIASMQEMTPKTIAQYFAALRGGGACLFYCCNREEKTLPDGTVARFSSYPWHESDVVVADGLCPWHQQFYTFKPPFYRSYDGPHLHRLVRLDGHA